MCHEHKYETTNNSSINDSCALFVTNNKTLALVFLEKKVNNPDFPSMAVTAGHRPG